MIFSILVIIVVCELLLIVREKKGVYLEIIIVLLISLVITITYEPTDWVRENKYIESLIANFFSLLLPLAIIVGANEFLIRIKNNIVKHITVIALALVVSFVGFYWGLYLICSLGVDCL